MVIQNVSSLRLQTSTMELRKGKSHVCSLSVHWGRSHVLGSCLAQTKHSRNILERINRLSTIVIQEMLLIETRAPIHFSLSFLLCGSKFLGPMQSRKDALNDPVSEYFPMQT